MKTILITGGAGFIGSHFIKNYIQWHPTDKVINLDLLTYAGNQDNLGGIQTHPNYTFVHGDIADKGLVQKLFSQHSIDMVVNFAAESHVDRSIDGPDVFIQTNIVGTQVLLDIAKRAWQIDVDEFGYPVYLEGVKFLQISTDEVYGALGQTGSFTEESPLQPNSPYSASKSSADLLVRSYFKTYKMPVNITRSSNNYGPNQYPEKLIPLMIHNAKHDKSLPVYGDGQQIRDWLHVKDNCSAIDLVLHKGIAGEVYNIGGDTEKTNLNIVQFILKTLNKPRSLITHVEDRLGHDYRYAVDSSKIQNELGWLAEVEFEAGLRALIND